MEEQQKDVQQEVQEAPASEPEKKEKVKKEKAPKEPKAPKEAKGESKFVSFFKNLSPLKLACLIAGTVVAIILIVTMVFAIVSTAKAAKNQKAINDLNDKLAQLTEEEKQNESEIEVPDDSDDSFAIEGAVSKENGYYLEVPNSQESIDLSKVIKTKNSWLASSNVDGSNPLNEKAVALQKGENVIYLLVKNGEKTSTYKLVVDRTESFQITYYEEEQKPYAVSFTYDYPSYGGIEDEDLLKTQYVGKDCEFKYPVLRSEMEFLFQGWYIYDEKEGDYVLYDFSQEINEDISLTALFDWAPNQLILNYDGQESFFCDFTVNSSYEYNFYALNDGYITISNNVGSSITIINKYFPVESVAGYGSATIYARAGDLINVLCNNDTLMSMGSINAPVVHTITGAITPSYNYVEKGPDKVDLVKFGDSYTSYVPTRPGYKFAGWYDGSELVELNGEFNHSNDLTLTAKWDLEEYNIDIVLLGKTYKNFDTYNIKNLKDKYATLLVKGEMVLANDPEFMEKTLSDPYMDFLGYFEDDKFLKEFNFNKEHTGDLTIYIDFSHPRYAIYLELGETYRNDLKIDASDELLVTLDYNYPGAPEPKTYIASHTQKVPYEIPTRDGYTFLGWFTSGGDLYTRQMVFYQDTRLYAEWEKDYDCVTDITGNCQVSNKDAKSNIYRVIVDEDQELLINSKFICRIDCYEDTYPIPDKTLFPGDTYNIYLNAGTPYYFIINKTVMDLIDYELEFTFIKDDYYSNYYAYLDDADYFGNVYPDTFVIRVTWGDPYTLPTVIGDHRYVESWSMYGMTYYVTPKYEESNNITLVPNYSYTPYTIEYDLQGGEFYNPSSVQYYYFEDSYLSLPEVTKQNSRFLGWALNPNETDYDNMYYGLFGIYGDLKLYAIYSEMPLQLAYLLDSVPEGVKGQEINIHLELNGGTCEGIQDIKANVFAMPEIPYIPTKDGYMFTGWYEDEELYIEYDSDWYALPKGDITLYASYVELLHEADLIYYPDMGSITIEAPNCMMGSKPYVVALYLEGGYDYQFTFDNCLSLVMDFRGANREAIEVIDSSNYSVSSVNCPTSHSEETYDFDYYSGVVYLLFHSSNIIGSGDITITSISKYPIMYDHSVYDTFNADGTYTIPFTQADIELPGYEFVGIYNVTNPCELKFGVANEAIPFEYYYFQYNLIPYTVEYDLTDVIENNPLNQFIYRTTDNYELYAPTVAMGMEFAGWYDNAEFNGEPIETLRGLTGNLKLYPKVVYAKVAIAFLGGGGQIDGAGVLVHFDVDADDATPVEDQFITQYKAIDYVIPSRPGYLFAGWYDEYYCLFDFNDVLYTDVNNPEMTLIATWEPIPDYDESYTYIQIDAKDYDLTDLETPITINKDTKVRYMYYATKYNYCQLQTHSYAFAEVVINGSSVSTNNIFTMNLYSDDFIIFEIFAENNVPGNYSFIFCGDQVVDNDPTTGFAFCGEYRKYYEVGEVITLPEVTREGYKLSGWYEDYSGDYFDGTELVEYLTPYEFYAEWEELEYTIKFNTSAYPSVAAIADFDYKYTDAISLPSPSIANMNFIGWYANPDHTGDMITASNIKTYNKDSITLYPYFEDIVYEATFTTQGKADIKDAYATIKFDLNCADCEPIPDQIVTCGTPMTLPIPERNGYIFMGWYYEEACNNFFDFEGIINSNLTLYACWEQTFSWCGQKYQIFDYNNTNKFVIDNDTYQVATAFVCFATGTYKVVSNDNLLISCDVYDASYNPVDSAYNVLSFEFDAYPGYSCTVYYEDYYCNRVINGEFRISVETPELICGTLQYGVYPMVVKANDDFKAPEGPLVATPGYSIVEGWVDSFDDPMNAKYDYDCNTQWYINFNNVTQTITFNYLTNSFTDTFEPAFITDLTYGPAVTGYEFKGWYDNAEFNGDPITEIPEGTVEDVVVYGKYELCTYEIKVNLEDEVISSNQPTGSIYSTNEVTISFCSNGVQATAIAPMKYSLGKVLELPVPYAEGYGFYGWFYDPKCCDEYYGEPIYEDTILYAGWYDYAEYFDYSTYYNILPYLLKQLAFVDPSLIAAAQSSSDCRYTLGDYNNYYMLPFNVPYDAKVKGNGKVDVKFYFNSSLLEVSICYAEEFQIVPLYTKISSESNKELEKGQMYYLIVRTKTTNPTSYLFASCAFETPTTLNNFVMEVAHNDTFTFPLMEEPDGYYVYWYDTYNGVEVTQSNGNPAQIEWTYGMDANFEARKQPIT